MSLAVLEAMKHPEVLEFFIYFTRFEFAIKSNGFTKTTGRDDTLSADWFSFWDKYKKKLLNPEIQDSLNYFKACPPKNRNSKGNWEVPSYHKSNDPDHKKLYRYLGTIRNNLFHGEKFDFLSDDTTVERNLHLIGHSLKVLKSWTKLTGFNGLF